MGQAQFHNSCSELQSGSLVEPAVPGAGAILVVAVAVGAILVAGVAAKVVVAAVEAVVGQA